MSTMEVTASAPAENRNAVVTGASTGIGLEICRQLASKGIMVILTARYEDEGIEAVEKLKGSGILNLVFHQLDVTDPASVASLVNFVKINYGKLDILVNNAATSGLVVNPETFKTFIDAGGQFTDVMTDAESLKGVIDQNYEKAIECLGTNYYGNKRVIEALLPLLQLSNSARIVNLSSLIGQIRFIYNEKMKEELSNVECLTEERLDELLQGFLKDFKEDKLKSNGWPLTLSAYKVSKAAINAYSRILARKFPKFLINCVHPGYVRTGFTFNTGVLTAEEAAKAPVMLALLPDNGPSGVFFDLMEKSSF